MKYYITLSLLTISLFCYSQNNIAGLYGYGTGHSTFTLDLKADSTFTFSNSKSYPNQKGNWSYKDSVITLEASGDTTEYFPRYKDTSFYYSKVMDFRLIDSLQLNPGKEFPKQELDTMYVVKNDIVIDTILIQGVIHGPLSPIGYYNKKLEYNKDNIVIGVYNHSYKYKAYNNGVPKSFIEYKKNLKHGIEINYYPNGVIESYGYWKKGKKKKKWKYF
jgi:antitoxin component YwqK of YwqJK toxin-antitoxin module